MRLNLGCGKVLLPWSAEKEAARHPMLSVPDTAYEPDWVNVDFLPLAGVDRQIDLFAYPWPWADNSVDEIWASHLIEHIPHAPRQACYDVNPWAEEKQPGPARAKRWAELKYLDGFYAFFAEVYRVLKPGGTITCLAPYGRSDGAMQDPQHTRFIIESTFHYLGNGGANSPTYDYRLPFSFEATALAFAWNPPYDQLAQVADGEPGAAAHQAQGALDFAQRTGFNIIREIRCELRTVK